MGAIALALEPLARELEVIAVDAVADCSRGSDRVVAATVVARELDVVARDLEVIAVDAVADCSRGSDRVVAVLSKLRDVAVVHDAAVDCWLACDLVTSPTIAAANLLRPHAVERQLQLLHLNPAASQLLSPAAAAR